VLRREGAILGASVGVMLKVESRVEARLGGWVCVVEFPWVMLSIFGIFDGSFASVAFQSGKTI